METSKFQVPSLKAAPTDDTAALTCWGLNWGERAIKAERMTAKLVEALRAYSQGVEQDDNGAIARATFRELGIKLSGEG